MTIRKKIKVLIVDDSMVFRETIAKGIAGDLFIEVVGTASDPYQARDRIVALEPDVMVLDVELPRMNGIEFLKRLMPQYPLPVVVMSGLGDYVFEALQAGAVDFVSKPSNEIRRGIDAFIAELVVKIKIASTARVGHWKTEAGPRVTGQMNAGAAEKIIAIGASTGGTEAIYAVLKSFPRDAPGTVMVQHMPPGFTKMYAERLNQNCLVEVKEAQDGDRLFAGRVLLAPGDYHMRIRKAGAIFSVECFKGERVNGHCPSVDVLFSSVAQQIGKNAVGVLLTGMGRDGASGMLEMRQKGARTIGQDEESSLVYGMPKVAYDIGAVEKQVPLNRVTQTVFNML